MPERLASPAHLRDPDDPNRSGRVYARADTPAFDPAEQLIGWLEQGSHAALCGSGMAAANAVFRALTPGDHVLVPRVMANQAMRHVGEVMGLPYRADGSALARPRV